MASKDLLRLAVLAAVVVICASAPASRSQAATGRGDGAQGGVLSAQTEPSALAAPVPGGPGFYSLGAIAFRPTTETARWAYMAPMPMLYNPGTDTRYWTDVNLPHGAAVTKFVLYFYDNDVAPGHDLNAVLLGCSLDAGDCVTMAIVHSEWAYDGYDHAETSDIYSPTVNNQSNVYHVYVDLPANASANIRLLGIRVDYEYSTVLPAVVSR